MKKPKYNLQDVEMFAQKYNLTISKSKKDIVLRGNDNFEGIEVIGKITKNFVEMKTIEVKRKLPVGTKEGWKFLREIRDNFLLVFSELKEYY